MIISVILYKPEKSEFVASVSESIKKDVGIAKESEIEIEEKEDVLQHSIGRESVVDKGEANIGQLEKKVKLKEDKSDPQLQLTEIPQFEIENQQIVQESKPEPMSDSTMTPIIQSQESISPFVFDPMMAPLITSTDSSVVDVLPVVEKDIEILSVEIFLDRKPENRETVKIGWKTDIPTNSKIFVWKEGWSTYVYNSNSGLSTSHMVNITNLQSGQTYFYEIEAVSSDGSISRKNNSFETSPVVVIKGDLSLELASDNLESGEHVNLRKVPLLKIMLTASGSNVSLMKLGVDMLLDTPNITLPQVIYLYNDNDLFSSATPIADNSIVKFENFQLKIPVDTSVTLTIKGDYLFTDEDNNVAVVGIPTTSDNSRFQIETTGEQKNITIPNMIQGNNQYLIGE